MKRTVVLSTIAMGLTVVANIALAAGTEQSLATVAVKDGSKRAIDCTPPNASSECAALHAQIRANFTPSEINLLFGSATSSKEYATSYASVKLRYEDLLNKFQDSNQVAVVKVGPITDARP